MATRYTLETPGGPPLRKLMRSSILGTLIVGMLITWGCSIQSVKPDAGHEAVLIEKPLIFGHGGVVVFDDTVDMAKQARFAMEFCAIESCGKCTPCRIGSTRGVETVDRIVSGENRAQNLEVLRDLCNTMKFGSLCALGGFTPYPVMSALTHFPEDFDAAPRMQAAE